MIWPLPSSYLNSWLHSFPDVMLQSTTTVPVYANIIMIIFTLYCDLALSIQIKYALLNLWNETPHVTGLSSTIIFFWLISRSTFLHTIKLISIFLYYYYAFSVCIPSHLAPHTVQDNMTYIYTHVFHLIKIILYAVLFGWSYNDII